MKYVSLTKYLEMYPELPKRATLIRLIKSGRLKGFQSCRCLVCRKLYNITKFTKLPTGDLVQETQCPKCKSMINAGGDFFVIPVAPDKIKRPKRGRRWPVKGEK